MSAISESIRTAALSWPLGYFGDVESAILNHAFSTIYDAAIQQLFVHDEVHARTFCLLVSEALND